MEWHMKEMSWMYMAVCAVCGSVITFASVAMVGFVGISLYSGTTVASITSFLFG